jgi:hypothetical protein
MPFVGSHVRPEPAKVGRLLRGHNTMLIQVDRFLSRAAALSGLNRGLGECQNDPIRFTMASEAA